MSTISSQLLVTSSAVVEDIYRGVSRRELTDSAGVNLGRLAVLSVSVLAAIFAWFRTDSILALVSFAWAGFGSSFGPIVILSLYWRKLTTQGALTGMLVGAVTVGVWGTAGWFGLYEIIPGFGLCLLSAIVGSKLTYKHNPAIDREFDAAARLANASREEIDEHCAS